MNSKPIARIALVLMPLLCLPLIARSQELAAGPAGNVEPQQPLDSPLTRLLERASVFHELAVAYIQKGDMDNALDAAHQLLQLEFPAEQEKLLAQGLAIIADKLGGVQQFDLAQSLLEDASEAIEQPINKARIFRMKARLYRISGDNDRAIESWKRALALDGPVIPR